MAYNVDLTSRLSPQQQVKLQQQYEQRTTKKKYSDKLKPKYGKVKKFIAKYW